MVSYTYDSWGKLITIDGSLKDTLGVKNPYRYRGYRHDTETGLYYLQSRYYNPEWGRFINADALLGSTGELLGHNVFAYCKNNAVNLFDPSGFEAVSRLYWEIYYGGGGLGIVVGLAASEVFGAVNAALNQFVMIADKVKATVDVLKNNVDKSKGNKNDNNNNSDKSDYKRYDSKQIEKKYGLKKGEFHKIKEEILSETRKSFPKDMKRVGDNPDIYLNENGLMKIVSRTNNYSFPTGWDIKSFLP